MDATEVLHEHPFSHITPLNIDPVGIRVSPHQYNTP